MSCERCSEGWTAEPLLLQQPAARRLLRRGSRLFNCPEKAAYGVCAAHYCAGATASERSPTLNPAATCSLSHRQRAERPRRSVFPVNRTFFAAGAVDFAFAQPITNTAKGCLTNARIIHWTLLLFFFGLFFVPEQCARTLPHRPSTPPPVLFRNAVMGADWWVGQLIGILRAPSHSVSTAAQGILS